MGDAPDGRVAHMVAYHVIRCPKRRRRMLVGLARSRSGQLIREVATENG